MRLVTVMQLKDYWRSLASCAL